MRFCTKWLTPQLPRFAVFKQTNNQTPKVCPSSRLTGQHISAAVDVMLNWLATLTKDIQRQAPFEKRLHK